MTTQLHFTDAVDQLYDHELPGSIHRKTQQALVLIWGKVEKWIIGLKHDINDLEIQMENLPNKDLNGWFVMQFKMTAYHKHLKTQDNKLQMIDSKVFQVKMILSK